ncbi:signal peptide protein [Noviherbaspirillum autotrophicum]|uniref:Signal peptide protein n=1 Tax=Noviherbaspirillum autotrophicum TaxID=709839 RepID=A0A0C2BQV6_9BURK|nr:signal peptide protein [Noviherbaspirillum autotrophicum]
MQPAPAVAQEFDIVLKPVAHPELGDIRIDENLFAIGRTEPPFDAYPPELVADLSRRHARIFSEYGAVYIADLGSKNGTTVNGVNIRQKTSRLQDGDEIGFSGELTYKVQLGARTDAPRRAAKVVSLTLTPRRDDAGLQPIVVTQFPFLISKADTTFSRYKSEHPHQVNYISRRHAHLFLKGGQPYVEDLGSTNGTFVAEKRLDEHAVPLKDGDVLAFGGHHFVYTVSLQTQEAELDPTITKLSQAVRKGAAEKNTFDVDKTTFVAAADSFLDIFCVDRAQPQDDELNDEAAKQADDPGKESGGRARGRFSIFAAELMQAFGGGEKGAFKRPLRWGALFLAALAVFAGALYLRQAPEGRLKELVADGDYPRAAEVADRYLKDDPDNAEVRALATEALLKAGVPQWAASLKARDFARADAALADMKRLGTHNADVQPLLKQLEWMDGLEKFVLGRGGPDAPIRLYADEERIRTLLKRWDEDTQGHQRSFATISSYVPAFRDPYAGALSHLRKLQSDDAVYSAAIERLKTTIASALNEVRPEELDAVLKEYAEKYPRIGGLDVVRQDLRSYTAILKHARERNLGPLVTQAAAAKFATPPFQARFRALQASPLFPPPDVMQQYQAVSIAWRSGDTERAFAGLQKMASGPWGEAASRELAHKKAIADQFAQLRKTRGSAGFDERLLAFYGSLDPGEDGYFARAVEPDVTANRGKAIARAQELLNRAQLSWKQYRDNGPIEGDQRLESKISGKYRRQAQLLSGAEAAARQGMLVYAQLKMEQPADGRKLRDDINAEAEQQRKALQELRNVLAPNLLKSKLELLGEQNDGNQRQPTQAAD